MQLPLDWYVYIIPGSLFLLSAILLLLDNELRIKICKFIKDNNLLALPIIIIVSFIIGASVDGFIHVLFSETSIPLEKEIIIQNTNPLLIEERNLEYSRMAFG